MKIEKIESEFLVSFTLNRREFEYLLEMMGRSSNTDIREILTKRKGLSKEFIDKAVTFSSKFYTELVAIKE